MQAARNHGRDVLSMAEGVRWNEGGSAQRLKALEREKACLNRLLADPELDKAILREAANGNF
jgi:hypothetical protein